MAEFFLIRPKDWIAHYIRAYLYNNTFCMDIIFNEPRFYEHCKCMDTNKFNDAMDRNSPVNLKQIVLVIMIVCLVCTVCVILK